MLDDKQLFYHIVVHRDSGFPIKPINRFFEYFLKPTVAAYKRFGLNARYKPVNDVVISGKKVSGNGAAELYDTMVLIGNVIIDMDLDLMASLLRVPDEKFRDKLAKSMREWVSSLKRELGREPSMNEVKETYIDCFKEVLGIDLVPGDLTDNEKKWMREISEKLRSKEWIYEPLERRREMERIVKIREGLYVVEKIYRAQKTLKLVGVVSRESIIDISIHGDFFLVPAHALEELEEKLKNKKFDEIPVVVNEWYKNVEFPGVSADDLIKAVLSLKPG